MMRSLIEMSHVKKIDFAMIIILNSDRVNKHHKDERRKVGATETVRQ
jgi:hypothetical protein